MGEWCLWGSDFNKTVNSANHMKTEHKNFLLKLSRESLFYYFKNFEYLTTPEDKVPDILRNQGASFVTLTLRGMLKGCIGRMVPERPLYLDVIQNTYDAAFNDYRFDPLKKENLKDIKIEISVLSPLVKLNYKDSSELLEFLEKNKPGVYIKSGNYSSTYLPQVWEQIPEPDEFLTELCIKAGLTGGHWMGKKLEVFSYTVENFSE
jgi:uncharacterized protein